MLTSLKIHWLKWQIKVLLRMRQLENKARNRGRFFWRSLHLKQAGEEVLHGKGAQMYGCRRGLRF